MNTKAVNLNKKGLAILISLLACFCFIFIFFILYSAGIIPGVNKETDEKKEGFIHAVISANTIEGSIIDRFGTPITYANTPGEAAEMYDEAAFSQLVGYNSFRYAQSGLRQIFFDDLFDGDKDRRGADLHITIDSQLQREFYSLLNGHMGSISAINAETGEILGLASRSDEEIDYYANKVDDIYSGEMTYFEKYNTIYEFWKNKATANSDTGGSTNKVITTAAAIETGMTDVIYDDLTGVYEIGNGKIVNAEHAIGGQGIDLQSGLDNSYNVYFANLATKIGMAQFKSTAEKYLINSDIELDFAILRSQLSFDGDDKAFLLASAGYGQGQQTISPLHIAMIFQSIINDGKMIRPYLVQSVVNNGKTVNKHKKTEIISETIGAENNSHLMEYLHNTALSKNYTFSEENYGYVIAKTGTAETGKTNSYGEKIGHVYIGFAVSFSNGSKYACCIDFAQTTGMYGVDLNSCAKSVIDSLYDYSYRQSAVEQG